MQVPIAESFRSVPLARLPPRVAFRAMSGRFATVYTDTQRAAVARAMLDGIDGRKVGAPTVVKLAAAGELFGLAPFNVPLSSVYSLRDVERRRRERKAKTVPPDPIAVDDPAAAARQLRSRVLTFAHGYLDRAENRMNAGTLPPADFKTASRAALDIAAEIERKGTSPADDAPAPAAEPKEPGDWIDKLKAETAQNGTKDTGPDTERDQQGAIAPTSVTVPTDPATETGAGTPEGTGQQGIATQDKQTSRAL